MLTEDRKRAGMSQRDYFNRLVDVETDRRLNSEFGDRNQTILDEAKDQALSETQLNLVHEETLAYALKAGQEPQFTKDETRAMVKADFDGRKVGSISSNHLMLKAGQIGKKIEEAGAKGDWAEAYRLSQQRNHSVIAAKLARAYEKSRAQFDRSAKTLGKNRTMTGVDQDYLNWIHDLLMRTGYTVRRSVQDLQENIADETPDSERQVVDGEIIRRRGDQLDAPRDLRREGADEREEEEPERDSGHESWPRNHKPRNHETTNHETTKKNLFSGFRVFGFSWFRVFAFSWFYCFTASMIAGTISNRSPTMP